ncbi:chromosome segregation ATPase-like protein [Marivivens niveibacter]|uniref:Chromosome segregation ATPase-like protein n=1 Tax=Marivivens niveibacter TaxID=1930667 RepID=A0A251WWS8_9RHOB|nr:chromosome segregation ATPase-like protein [Marivivens niveibacter]OUD08929.1 chromosome segregation ATPase-like protein [Marivivens niveibacter]
MFDANLYIFIALCVSVVVLIILSLSRAIVHDKVINLQAPLATESEVLARIREKRETLTDLEGELEKRRAALANVADIQAELDATVRQLDEAKTEWEQMSERREEILALRHETEQARVERLEIETELVGQKAELEHVRDRLERADALVGRIEELESRKTELEISLAALRDEEQDLKDAEAELRRIVEKIDDLTQLEGTLTGKLEAKKAEISEQQERINSLRNFRAGVDAELDAVNATLAAAKQKSTDVEEHAARLEEQVLTLEARKAVLEDAVRKLNAKSSGGADPDEDPMRELKQRPQVIERLVEWSEPERIDEADAIKNVKKRFDAFALQYPERTLRAFHTSMKVNDTTQMTVLAGISGTGKSQLPRQYAAGMGIGFLQVPVQPRWDSPQDLMGFYNYIEGRFRPTDMARALYALDTINNPENAVQDRMMMVLLDEMNLARVEYYFSDFLSRLESRPARDAVGEANLRKDAEIELEIPNAVTRIFPGYNLLFAGTMNEDESTQSLSDKVVDRANVMRFGAPKTISKGQRKTGAIEANALSLKAWERWCNRSLRADEKSAVDDAVNSMLELMRDFGKPFGHRLGRAIEAYATVYPEAEGVSDRVGTALADQIEMRLLPKLRGVDVEEKAAEFEALERMASKFGDDSLAEAVRKSVEDAELTGQFVWKGVIR